AVEDVVPARGGRLQVGGDLPLPGDVDGRRLDRTGCADRLVEGAGGRRRDAVERLTERGAVAADLKQAVVAQDAIVAGAAGDPVIAGVAVDAVVLAIAADDVVA